MADELPEDWQRAIARIADEGFARIVVLGPTDAGKSSFVRALTAAVPGLAILDVDPGQKLAGPVGTISLGERRFVFIGSTSPVHVNAVVGACRTLAAEAGRFVANTSGFVQGLGTRLQAATIAALDADLIVAIDGEGLLDPILARHTSRAVIRLSPSPLAQKKTPSLRARIRQESFAAALAGAAPQDLADIVFDPAPPLAITLGEKHPIVALADADGTDMALGILEAASGDSVRVVAPLLPRPVRTVRLGSMWAAPGEAGWKLLETLHPSWIHDEPES